MTRHTGHNGCRPSLLEQMAQEPQGSVADPDPACNLDVDPDQDPACIFGVDPDPDPTFHSDADIVKAQNLENVIK
jgi:hypothetical protein